MKSFLKKLSITLAITTIFAYGIYTIIYQQKKINMQEEEKEKCTASLALEEMRTEKLMQERASINTDEYKEEYARETWGLVKPYETIIYLQ